MAQDQVARHARPAEVQIAVGEPQGFLHVALVGDAEGGWKRRVQHVHPVHDELDLSRGERGVLGARGARLHRSLHLQHILWPYLARDAVGLGCDLRVEDHLRPALAVPQVDEDQPPVVPVPVDPALEQRSLAGVAAAQLTTEMGSTHLASDGVLSFEFRVLETQLETLKSTGFRVSGTEFRVPSSSL
jgi:hypothetical protein